MFDTQECVKGLTTSVVHNSVRGWDDLVLLKTKQWTNVSTHCYRVRTPSSVTLGKRSTRQHVKGGGGQEGGSKEKNGLQGRLVEDLVTTGEETRVQSSEVLERPNEEVLQRRHREGS